MKRLLRITLLTSFFLTVPFVMNSVFAQDPPPPPDGGGGGGGGGPVGSTPIDGGMSFMLILGAAYGAKKNYIKK